MSDEMPADPFGPPEEMLTMMGGIAQLYHAAVIKGLPEHVATNFITGVFCSLMTQGAQQNAAAQSSAAEEEIG